MRSFLFKGALIPFYIIIRSLIKHMFTLKLTLLVE